MPCRADERFAQGPEPPKATTRTRLARNGGASHIPYNFSPRFSTFSPRTTKSSPRSEIWPRFRVVRLDYSPIRSFALRSDLPILGTFLLFFHNFLLSVKKRFLLAVVLASQLAETGKIFTDKKINQFFTKTSGNQGVKLANLCFASDEIG